MSRGSAISALALVISLGSASRTAAQAAGDSVAPIAPPRELSGDAHARAPVVVAVRAPGEIAIDGRLDDEPWSSASPATRFTQTDPHDGRAASERTEVRILFDDDALYIGARMWDASGRPSQRLSRRDANLSDSDWFRVSFDTFHDHQTSAVFRVNPLGVRGDELAGDGSWDPVWEVATHVDGAGWTAEMRIPFSQLRFSRDADQTWGIQLSRTIAAKQETHVFAFTPKHLRGGVGRYGHLHGLSGIRSGRPLEVMPYVAARAEYRDIRQNEGVDFANPYRDGSDWFSDAGVDLKYRPTSNLTLDVTVNPDFGQVEFDPAVLNLSANETRLDERRPFFIEGANIFSFTGTSLLHSRRVGRDPQGARPSGTAYIDIPDATTILGAAKLTGRTARGWNVGILQAVTARETAPYVDTTGVRGRAVVEPMTSHFAARVERDFRDGESSLGGMATAVNRALDVESMATRLRGAAYSGGLDFKHEWAQRAWVLRGAVAGSYIRGRPEVMIAAQRASQRYFHRPDASHLQVDSLAASMQGYTARLSLNREAGRNWSGGATIAATSPGFEVNDLGFQSSADRITGHIDVEYEERVPGETFRSWSVRANGDSRWNYGGERLDQDVNVRVGATLLNYWSGSISYFHGFGSFDDRFTRGGPLTVDVPSNGVDIGFNTDLRKAYTLRGGAGFDWEESGAGAWSANLTAGLKPMQTWSIELGPRVGVSNVAAQWITAHADPAATETFGRRYIYAHLDQTTVALDTRLNVTFSPGLTLGLFIQPFLASGRYGDPMELRAPRTFEFLRYGTDTGTRARDAEGDWVVDPDGTEGVVAPFSVSDPAFNRRSLRGSAALRWEWRAGSSLYAVWRQERSDEIRRGDFVLRRDAQALFHVRPQNVFLVKASYWLSL